MATELRYNAQTGETEEVEYAPAPPPVPEVVTRRQAKRALLDVGLLSQIDGVIAGMPSPQRERAKIDWDEALEFRRDSPLVAFLGAVLGLNEAQIDALFIAAAAIV